MTVVWSHIPSAFQWIKAIYRRKKNEIIIAARKRKIDIYDVREYSFGLAHQPRRCLCIACIQNNELISYLLLECEWSIHSPIILSMPRDVDIETYIDVSEWPLKVRRCASHLRRKKKSFFFFFAQTYGYMRTTYIIISSSFRLFLEYIG